MATAVPNRQYTFRYDFPTRIQQFDIKGFTQIRRAVQFRCHNITLKPNRVSLIITALVDLYIDFFLWQHFSKIQCNRDYNPKKKTVLAFAVGLHLSEDETIDLLKSAGYAFSDGSKRDWIVRYCLEHKIYNINQVNTLLFEYDQEQLGA